MQALFDAAPLPVVVHRGADHVIEMVNPVACMLLGRRAEDLLGRPAFEAIPELRDHEFRGLLDRMYKTGAPQVGRDMPARLDRDGSGRVRLAFFDVVFTPLRDAERNVIGALALGSDVTDQVIARREVNDLREAAESANRAKDEFLAMLGHELRNPLAPILTALQLLKLRGIEAGERERAIIERQVKHLVSLVDDLLDVSRITRGKIELRHEVIEAADFIARAIEMASPLLEQQRHDLTVEVSRTGLPVDGDMDRLAQVVANLLTNAAKYTEPGGTIAVRARVEGADVVVSVTDSGIGIDKDMLPQVFDLFVQQRQTLERSRGGLGLGLAIVRSLVGLHGGTVSVASGGAGQGSEFTIRLPRAVSSLASVPMIDEGAAARLAPGEAGARVLVVDDNRDGAILLAETLSAFGYQARAVHDGPAALAMAEQFDPDVALLDIGLPVMDGFELARQFALRAGLSRTKLVAVTGYGQEQDRAESAQAGFVAHLVKPVDLGHLRRVIESALSG
jgi:PAS domain S-box-containing protein